MRENVAAQSRRKERELTPILALGIAGTVTVVVGQSLLFRFASVALHGAVLATAATGGALTVVLGSAIGIDQAQLLIGLALFGLPVAVALGHAFAAVGARATAIVAAAALWSLVVLPVATLAPLVASQLCETPGCAIIDFGGTLPLAISGAAFVLFAWLVPTVPRTPPRSRRRLLAGLLLIEAGAVAWLVHLEGAIDGYLGRILVAALVAPVAATVGWLIVDRLRGTPQPGSRLLIGGLVSGLVAVAPGAVTIALPWVIIVSLAAGVVAAVVRSARALGELDAVTRWGLALIAASVVGLLAPPIVGETVGIVFSARFDSLGLPVVSTIGVVVWAAIVSMPLWLRIRRVGSAGGLGAGE